MRKIKHRFSNRLLIILPNNRKAPLEAWIKQQSFGRDGGNWFTVPLNSTGDMAQQVTHWAAFFPADADILEAWMDRLIAQGGATKPPGFKDFTPKQKRQWLEDNRQAIFARIGVRTWGFPNETEWGSIQDKLAEAGLFVVKDTSRG